MGLLLLLSENLRVVIPLAIALGFILYKHRQSKSSGLRSLPRPPGPKPHWLFGNVFDLPLERPWERFRDWTDTYGNVAGSTFTAIY